MFEAPVGWLGVEGMSGHLTGVPAPAGGQVIEVTYTPMSATIVLAGVPCGPGIAPAYTQSLGPAGFSPMPTAHLVQVAHADGRSIFVTCESARGLDVVSITSLGAMSRGWNPWNLSDWRIGPFSVIPPVNTGSTYKPHAITLTSTESVAALTPKTPTQFIESLDRALTEAGWTSRPEPGGTSWSHREDVLAMATDGARVDLRLYKTP